MISTIIFFILLIGVLVLVHEFGHFFAAKKFGVRVEEFAFGFPPRLFGFIRGGTRYALNLLPIGGYVKIFCEAGEGEGNPDSFISRPVWQRFLIVVMGVLMNLVLAWLLFTVSSAIGLPTAVTDENQSKIKDVKVGIIGVADDSPAKGADIRFGDLIIKAESGSDSALINTPEDLQQFISAHLGVEVVLQIERGRMVFSKKVMPRSITPEGEGPLGIVLSKVGIFKVAWYLAGWEGIKLLSITTAGIVVGLYDLFWDLFATGRISTDISGPVGIFVFAREFNELGFVYLLQLAALLSINLAILNAFPFPALDGGRMLFLAIEKIKGSKVDQRVEKAIHTAGFIILILLMVAVTYRDIAKIF